MGRARDISKVFSTGTALATDTEVSGSYLTLASASTTYQTKATAGLTLLNTTTFTAAAAVSFSSLFSASYTNYRIVMSCTGDSSTGRDAYLRYRNDTTDYAANEYNAHNYYRTSGTGSNQVTGVMTSAYIGHFGDLGSGIVVDIHNPFGSTRKIFNSLSDGWSNSGNRADWCGGFLNTTTSFNGCTIYPNAGSITGSASVYGYNK